MAKRGRPSLASAELKREITDRLSQGVPLAVICRDPHMPTTECVRQWKLLDAAFDCDIARARDDGHDVIAARTMDVARGGEGSSGDVQRDKLIVDTDLKLLAKWDKRYSDKLVVESKAEVVHRYDLDSLGSERLDELERILADAARGEGGTGEAEPASVH